MSSPIDNYRNYLATNYPDMKLPAGKPYGVIKLAKGYDFGFHVRKDHVSVHFISNGTHDPEEVMGYINDNGIGDKTYGDGLEPDVFRGKRNAAVVRCEVHIPLESVDELRKPTLRKHSQQIFGELYDDFSGIAGVERPKPKEDTAETVEEVAEAPAEEKSDEEQAKDEIHIERYENGQKKSEGTYKDGKEDGLWTWWYENGQKWCEGTYKDGKQDGLWTNWHDQTEKSQEGTFKDGKREGIWTFWYKHGQKKKEGPYRDGKEDGLWTGWHENGQKSSEKTFKNGESISEECWDEDENVTDQSNFNNKADEKNKMIITEETEVESSPDYKIVNIIGTFDGEEFILSRIHSHPVEGQDDLWERTDIEVKKNESSEDDNVLVDRYFAADFDYEHM